MRSHEREDAGGGGGGDEGGGGGGGVEEEAVGGIPEAEAFGAGVGAGAATDRVARPQDKKRTGVAAIGLHRCTVLLHRGLLRDEDPTRRIAERGAGIAAAEAAARAIRSMTTQTAGRAAVVVGACSAVAVELAWACVGCAVDCR